MRKLSFATAVFMWVFAINAQISIESKHMPSAGDTARLSISNPTNLPSNWNESGASKQWDFSKLAPIATQLREFKSSFRTPYAFYFFNQVGEKTQDTLAFGPITFTNLYSFYSKSSSTFKTEGIGYSASGVPLAAKYTDDDELYQFPLEYNDSDVSTFRFKFEVSGQWFSIVQAGTRYNVADAYGSIKTPYKSYDKVLRVKTLIDEVDTLYTPAGKNTIPRKQIEYKWFSQDEIVPVMQVNATVSPLGGIQVTQILYRDSFRTLRDGGGGINPPVMVDFDVDKKSGNPGDIFKFSNTSSPFLRSFNWEITPKTGVSYENGTNNQSQNPEVSFSQPGLYSVKLTGESGPVSGDTLYQDLISIDWGAGLSNLTSDGCLKIYPNPSADWISPKCTCPTLLPVQWPDRLTVVGSDAKQFEIKKSSSSPDGLVKYDIRDLPLDFYYLQFGHWTIRFNRM